MRWRASDQTDIRTQTHIHSNNFHTEQNSKTMNVKCYANERTSETKRSNNWKLFVKHTANRYGLKGPTEKWSWWSWCFYIVWIVSLVPRKNHQSNSNNETHTNTHAQAHAHTRTQKQSKMIERVCTTMPQFHSIEWDVIMSLHGWFFN